MKVKIATLMLYMFCIIHVNAQQKTDGFFNEKYKAYTRAYVSPNAGLNQTSGVGIDNMNINIDEGSVPLGNGLLVLTVISTSYLMLRRKEECK